MQNTTLIHLVLLVLFISSCTTTTCLVPDGFADASATARDDIVCKAIDPQGVVYRVRRIQPTAQATPAFWQETLQIQLEKQGYRLIERQHLPQSTRPTFLMRFEAPLIDEDYSYDILLLGEDDHNLLLVEATGPKSKFANAAAPIRSAMLRLAAAE